MDGRSRRRRFFETSQEIRIERNVDSVPHFGHHSRLTSNCSQPEGKYDAGNEPMRLSKLFGHCLLMCMCIKNKPVRLSRLFRHRLLIGFLCFPCYSLVLLQYSHIDEGSQKSRYRCYNGLVQNFCHIKKFSVDLHVSHFLSTDLQWRRKRPSILIRVEARLKSEK